MNVGGVIGAMMALVAQSPDTSLATLSRWLPGRYDTFAQATADSVQGTAYRHVRAVLAIVPVTITALEADARAFYLEQALDGQQAAPYRQRVIIVRVRNGVVSNELYRLASAADFVGFAGGRPLTMQELQRESGCDAQWERISAQAFRGVAGAAGQCASTLRGATHVESHFELRDGLFVTLDQGRDAAGAVRWGPPDGVEGHRFVRRVDSPPAPR